MDYCQWVGLFRFDEKQEKIVERIIANPTGRNTLLQSGIIALQDIGKEIFIGYVSQGFSLYNKTSKTFQHYSKSDGLVSNNITDAIEAKDGILWIATRNGISRFDRAKKEFINYGY